MFDCRKIYSANRVGLAPQPRRSQSHPRQMALWLGGVVSAFSTRYADIMSIGTREGHPAKATLAALRQIFGSSLLHWSKFEGKHLMCRRSRVISGVRRLPNCLLVLAWSALFSRCPAPRRCDIIPVGDVSPANPSGWTISTTGYIGNTASGTLTINADSDLLSNYGHVGYGNSQRRGECHRAGPSWTNSSNLSVGESGSGTLTVSSGAAASSQYGYIGANQGSTGFVAVSGAGSTLTVGGLDVGQSESGTLSITDGGSVASSSFFDVGYRTGSSGAVGLGCRHAFDGQWHRRG